MRSLDFAIASAVALTLVRPADPNVTPPGHYQLFIVNGSASWIPSVGRIVRFATTSSSSGPITLSVTGRSDATTQYMTLKWSGAKSATVDIYRNGNFRSNTPNDGKAAESRAYTGAATYIYKICEGGVYNCSNPATISFNGGATTSNKPPISAFTPSCTGISCSFKDGSVDLDGTLTAWQWDFGDGTGSTLGSPSHDYAAGGSYTVTLTVTDNRNAKKSSSQVVTVQSASSPLAEFSSSCTDVKCDFTDKSTDNGSVVKWSWTFGDNGTATNANPSHDYSAAGAYNVTLTVTDKANRTSRVTHKISVSAPAAAASTPLAAFTSSCTDLTCNFTDTSSDTGGSIVSWTWDFDDGTTSQEASPTHTFAGAGGYQVKLTVKDDHNVTKSVTQMSTVTAPT